MSRKNNRDPLWNANSHVESSDEAAFYARETRRASQMRARREQAEAQESLQSADAKDLDIFKALLSKDPYLKEYICPIKYEVTSDPCRLKGEPQHIYEHEALLKWIRQHHNSPISRTNKLSTDIEKLPHLKAFIEHRKKHLTEDVNQQLLDAANEELQPHQQSIGSDNTTENSSLLVSDDSD